MRFIIVIFLITFTVNAQVKAFPGAYGAGSVATGARGLSVYHVTNLNNTGTGSFRDAVSASNRNIVFDVSGTIALTSSLTIVSDNLTIAGQTAPQGGITIVSDFSGGDKFISFEGANNVIIRYIRVRLNLDDYSWGGVDAVKFRDCTGVIVSNSSFSWGTDETLTFWQACEDITIQDCLIGEGKTGSIFGDSDNPAINIDMSFIRNVYYNVTHRHPNLNSNGRVDVINNLVFNWKYRLSRVSGGIELNHIGNYYSLGSLSSITNVGMMVSLFFDDPSIYTDDTIVDNEGSIIMSKTDDDWTGLWQDWNSGSDPHIQAATTYRSLSKFADLSNPPTIIDTDNLIDSLVVKAGANKYLDAAGGVNTHLDNVDTVYLANIASGAGVSYTSSSGGNNYNTTTHWGVFWASVSATPINTRSGSYDTDADGMADTWETATFGDLTKTGTADTNANGYTDLEEFLNLVDSEEVTGNVSPPLTELQKQQGKRSKRRLMRIIN